MTGLSLMRCFLFAAADELTYPTGKSYIYRLLPDYAVATGFPILFRTVVFCRFILREYTPSRRSSQQMFRYTSTERNAFASLF